MCGAYSLGQPTRKARGPVFLEETSMTARHFCFQVTGALG